MKLGLVGLGKMGSNMRYRLHRAGIDVVGFDIEPGERDVESLAELVKRLDQPRVVWAMVPVGESTTQTILQLKELLDEGDLVVDGGNSRYKQAKVHAELLATKGIGFVDCGVSGGIWGRHQGYALMVGGADKHVERLMPVFDALRPEGPREESFVHTGRVGAGHFAKMVHNGIEYGMMQALAEGYELLASSDMITDEAAVVKAWQRGTVVRSWLLELLVSALEVDPELEQLHGYVQDSGEARWMIEEAVNRGVPMPAITLALYGRFASRQDDSPAMRAVAALRKAFGGHDVEAKASH